jgi:hypothetical protein
MQYAPVTANLGVRATFDFDVVAALIAVRQSLRESGSGVQAFPLLIGAEVTLF